MSAYIKQWKASSNIAYYPLIMSNSFEYLNILAFPVTSIKLSPSDSIPIISFIILSFSLYDFAICFLSLKLSIFFSLLLRSINYVIFSFLLFFLSIPKKPPPSFSSPIKIGAELRTKPFSVRIPNYIYWIVGIFDNSKVPFIEPTILPVNHNYSLNYFSYTITLSSGLMSERAAEIRYLPP